MENHIVYELLTPTFHRPETGMGTNTISQANIYTLAVPPKII